MALKRIPIELAGGLYTSADETRVPVGRLFACQNVGLDNRVLQQGGFEVPLSTRPGALPGDVCYGGGYGKYLSDAVQSVEIFTGVPTSGGFTLLIDADTTASIPFNATAAASQTIAQALPQFADGEITVQGGAFPSNVQYFAFHGVFGGQPQGHMSVAANTMNNGAVVAITDLVLGGLHEVILVVIQPAGVGTCTLYSVTSSDGFIANFTWTSVATGLEQTNWFFEQLGDKIYAVNAQQGIAFYQLGGGWSAPAGIPNVQNPVTAPSAAPFITYLYGIPTAADFAAGITWSGAFATNHPNVLFLAYGMQISPTVVPISNAACGLTTSFNTPQNLSQQDYWFLQIALGSGVTIDASSIVLQLITSGGSPITISPDQPDAGEAVTGFVGRGFYFGELTETERASIISIIVSFTIVAAPVGGILVVSYFPLDVYMNDTMQTLSLVAGPTVKPIKYGYTYLQASTGDETAMSPLTATVPAPPAVNFGLLSGTPAGGCAVQLIAPVNAALTAADLIIFYRLDEFGIPRRIGINPNAGGSNFMTDAFMADELFSFQPYGLIQLPGGFQPDLIGLFNGSLCIGSGPLLFMSYVGVPNQFAPAPSQFGALSTVDQSDPAGPRTLFMSQNRSEPVLAIVGQSALYLAGDKSSYAMSGGTEPLALSPSTALPGSRGALGQVASCPLGDGALIATQTGLYYYSVPFLFGSVAGNGQPEEKELTSEVEGSWRSFTSGGFPGDGSATIVRVWNEEIWCLNTLAYLHRSRKGLWDSGTFQNAYKTAISDPVRGLIGITGPGGLVRLGAQTPATPLVPAFAETGPSDDPAPLGAPTWSAQTGIMDVAEFGGMAHLKVAFERVKVGAIECVYEGAPTIFIEAWDGVNATGKQRFDLTDGKYFHMPQDPSSLLQGVQFQITVQGGVNDQVKRLALWVEELPMGRNI